VSPKSPIPDAGLRLIERLQADRAKDPRQWVLTKHKPHPKRKSEHDGLPDGRTILGLGETTVGLLVKSGQIQSMKVGGATRLNRDSILEWMMARVQETYGLKEKPKADGRRAVLARGSETSAEKRKAKKRKAEADKRACGAVT
jgi:excisionase family DNA binding protein